MIEAWTELGDKPNILGTEIKALGLFNVRTERPRRSG